MEDPIFINGSATGVGAHNWTWVQTQSWFGGGTGMQWDPYRIGNFTISGNHVSPCLEIVESTSVGTGMAADGLILMPEVFFAYKNMVSRGMLENNMAQFLAHEIAHTYWGLAINVDLARTNWLSEAFAEYLGTTYLEEKHGSTGNAIQLSGFFKYTLYNYLYTYNGIRFPMDFRKGHASL